MKTIIMTQEKLAVSPRELEDFMRACKNISGVNFIAYNTESEQAEIEYKYGFNLYYLGQSFALFKAVVKL